MGKIKGQKEYEKFTSGKILTRKQAMLAQCYSCNGFEDSNTDCQGESCPLYQFSPYKGIKKSKVPEDSEEVAQAEKAQP
jgi:hypothetical protein